MKWRYIVPGDLITVRNATCRVESTDTNGAVTIHTPDGDVITRRPNPDGEVRLVRGADPENGAEDLRELVRLTGCTLAEAAELCVRLYLGGVELGEERPDGTYRCKLWEAMDGRERWVHAYHFHGTGPGEHDSSTQGVDHTHA